MSVAPDHTDIISIASPIKLSVTKEINGAWYANMRIKPDDYITAESYVDITDIEVEEYIVKRIKKIKSAGKYYYDVYLEHNMSELADITVERFYILKSVTDVLTHILDGSGWTAGTCDLGDTILMDVSRRVSVLEALNQLAAKISGELYYHSKTKIVDLKRQIGTATKAQLRYDKNCDYIEKEEDSSRLITKIIPYDSDNNTINTEVLDDCEDETTYIPLGAGTTAASTFKRNMTQGIELNFAALNETMIRDLGAGAVIDLTGHTSLKFWIYSSTANAAGVTFGIGESAYTEDTVDTGALTAGCWHDIELDLSGVADADKNAIRYIGLKNLTDAAITVVIDYIRAFDGDIYIESDNVDLYRVKKEYVYNHSSKREFSVVEVILYPTDDAYTRQDNPNANINGVVSAVEGTDGIGIWNNFHKWDLSSIPDVATITAATMYIYQYQGSGTLSSASTYLCDADFVESTITYNNQPSTSGASFHTWDFKANGWHNDSGDILTTAQGWKATPATNYGITIRCAQGRAEFYTTEIGVGVSPYLKITYTITTAPEDIIKAASQLFLQGNDEPRLSYKAKWINLSKVIVDTWKDEKLDLGDTARMYDYDIKNENDKPLNVDVRVKKITKDLLDARNNDLELTNKAYIIADIEAKKTKQLNYAMPFHDDPTIIDGTVIQQGYLGSDVN